MVVFVPYVVASFIFACRLVLAFGLMLYHYVMIMCVCVLLIVIASVILSLGCFAVRVVYMCFIIFVWQAGRRVPHACLACLASDWPLCTALLARDTAK